MPAGSVRRDGTGNLEPRNAEAIPSVRATGTGSPEPACPTTLPAPGEMAGEAPSLRTVHLTIGYDPDVQ